MEINLNIEKFKMPHQFKELRRLSGIYFLMKNGEVEYIGRSVNIENRLSSHHVFDRYYHDEVWVHQIGRAYFDGEWHKQKELETLLIQKIQPPKNISSTIRQTIIQTGKHRHG